MKSILSIFVLVTLFFLLSAESCDRSGKALKTVKAASFLLGTKDSSSTASWKKISSFDPYMGGQYQNYADYATYITLHADGTYEEKDPENYTTGKYFINKTKSAIAFIPENVNGTKQKPLYEEPLFRHEIIKFSDDSLILAWQGRHGMIQEVYVSQPAEKE